MALTLRKANRRSRSRACRSRGRGRPSRSRPRPSRLRAAGAPRRRCCGQLSAWRYLSHLQAEGRRLRRRGLRRRRRRQCRFSPENRRWAAHDARLLGGLRRRRKPASPRPTSSPTGALTGTRLRSSPFRALDHRKGARPFRRRRIRRLDDGGDGDEGAPAPEGGQGGLTVSPMRPTTAWISPSPLRCPLPIRELQAHEPLRAEPEPNALLPLTPMMAQYFEIKAANPDCLLVEPDGRFLRAFLRRRRDRQPGARHRSPPSARQARGSGHPHVRGAD